MGTDFRTMYGWAELSPSRPAVAGSTGTFVLTYHVGEYGVDDGGTLKIAFRFASDWGCPQSNDPRAPDYVTVTTDGPGKLSYRYDPKGYIRPYQKCLTIDVKEWALCAGNTVRVTYGDTSGGSPGTTVQTFREHTFEFKVAVDAFGTGQFVELDQHPTLEIVPSEAAKLVAIAPTEVVVGEPFAVGVKLEDEWGNPAVGYRGAVSVANTADFSGLPASHTYGPDDAGVWRVEGVACAAAGVHVIQVREDMAGLAADSNPIVCVARAGELRPYWGDLHGQSEETVGTNSIDDYFAFARDVALVDFVGHQGNDFQITPEFWRQVDRCSRQYDEPGRFVVFPGYEWSATTPAGGDHNVYYLRDGEEIHRTSHWQIADKSDVASDRHPISELYAQLRGGQAMVVPHIGGRPANLEFHDPDLEPVIEIYSAWGQFEWLLREAVERGYKVGFVAGSDDHKGRPGASYPGSSSFGVYGGLTCVLARDLSREGIWEAVRARRCYATSGQRIALDVRADGPSGRAAHLIGEELAVAGAPRLTVRATGTADIEEVLVMRGLECVYRYPEEMPRDHGKLRVVWSGARIRGRDRIARWDGHLELVGGSIAAAAPYAFDSAAEAIVEQTPTRVAWRSATSGDEDGVVLALQGADRATLGFRSEIASFDLDLAQLNDEPHVVEAGGVDLEVRVEYLPLGLQSRSCEFTFTDREPVSGCSPYYVRLTQVDGARAWTSPFYMHCP